MKPIKLNSLFIALALTIALASCHKDKITQNSGTPTAQRAGIYILNQGEFGDDNSTLTYYNYATKQLIPDYFAQANAGKQLGDTGNDIEIYGSKMYIVVNNSNVVDVANSKTGVLIGQVAVTQGRSIVFNQGKAFVSSYDAGGEVFVIDTASLKIINNIYVGSDPEQMVVANNKLYVANSGGLNTVPDSTLSVINLSSLVVENNIKVIPNPVSVTSDVSGNVYVLSIGNYGNIAGGLTVIDNNADTVLSKPKVNIGFNIPITNLGNQVYFPTADNKIAVYSSITKKIIYSNFITDGTTIKTPYAIQADPTSGEVFVTDAVDYQSNGILYAFDSSGKLEYKLTVGINPGKIAFVNK
ncbi:DUF5074 domain-containing protein [Mucilaginibacter sp.]